MKHITPEVLRTAANLIRDGKANFMCHAVSMANGEYIFGPTRDEFELLLIWHGVDLNGSLGEKFSADSDKPTQYERRRALRIMFLEFLALELESREELIEETVA